MSFKFTFIFASLPSTTRSSSQKDETAKQKMQTDMGRLPRLLQFLFVTGMLTVVGSRVASLVVLEFCLRALSGWVTAGAVRNMLVEIHCFDSRLTSELAVVSLNNFLSLSQESRKYVQQVLIQSQFSVGCALSCSLHFLHEGAAHSWLCLILAAALSWFLARQAMLLERHVMALFQLHSSQSYCGICISLLTSGHCLLPLLCRIVIITFFVALVAAISIINKHFLSATEALRFWTPLTICYTLLIVYMQGKELIGNTQIRHSSLGEMHG